MITIVTNPAGVECVLCSAGPGYAGPLTEESKKLCILMEEKRGREPIRQTECLFD